MKKNILKLAVFSLLAVPALTSCELDQIPNSTTTPDNTWNTLADAESYRMGLYAAFRSCTGGIYSFLTDIQTDDFVATYNFGNYYGSTYTWTFGNADTDDQNSIWAANYGMVAAANNVINNLPRVSVTTPEEETELNQILGEAHLFRAMAYHRLVVLFAKDYEPETAAQEPGLPLFDRVDPMYKPARASLEDTYKFIFEDLKMARDLMTDADPTKYLTDPTMKDYMLTNDVLDLFEARVSLCAHKYTEAVDLCKGLMEKYALATTADELKDMWLNDRGSEIMWQLYQSKDERGPGIGSLVLGLNNNLSDMVGLPIYIPSWYMSGDVQDMYNDKDIRLSSSLTDEQYVYLDMEGGTLNKARLFNKYPGNPALQKNNTDYYNMVKVFRAPEIYLIAAEAAYMAGEPGDAKTYLNELHQKSRKNNAIGSSVNGTRLLNAIKNEWRMEYVGEGMRFGCLKRWHDGFKRSGLRFQPMGTMPGTNYVPCEITADNKRWVWEIPQQDLNDNKNLRPNW